MIVDSAAVASSGSPMRGEYETFENDEGRVYLPSQAIQMPVVIRK